MNIGERIKKYRKIKDLTQEKLADYLCVSYQAVSKWETGISSPDLSMIAPLTKLLNISADELLGLTEPYKRRDELEVAYDSTWKTGDLNERHKVAETAVKEYPGEMKYLDWLAWTTAMCSFEFKDEEAYIAEQEKAIKMFETVIANCTDEAIKKSSIAGITQYLQFRGRKEEALKYAELYPEENSLRKDDILFYCLSGDEKIKHCQKMLMNSLYDLLSKLSNYNTLQSRKFEETLIKIFIPDENYLNFHSILYTCLRSQADYLTREKLYDEAVNIIERVLYHAREYDKIDVEKDKVFNYTAPMFDMVEHDNAKMMRSGTTTLTESFYEWLENNYFDPLRNRNDFKKLAGKK